MTEQKEPKAKQPTKHEKYQEAVSACAKAWHDHAKNEADRDANQKRRFELIESLRDHEPDSPAFQELRQQINGLRELLQPRSKHSLREFGAACEAKRQLLVALKKPITAADRDQVMADIEAAMKVKE